MRDQEQSSKARHSKCNVARLANRMVGILTRHGKLIEEHRSCFVEGNTMLLDIGFSLRDILLELHHCTFLALLRITNSVYPLRGQACRNQEHLLRQINLVGLNRLRDGCGAAATWGLKSSLPPARSNYVRDRAHFRSCFLGVGVLRRDREPTASLFVPAPPYPKGELGSD